MKIFKEKFENISLFIRNRNYREFVRLLFQYGKVKRNSLKEINFLGYQVSVPDCLSFIFQFKEIFVKQYYRFESDSHEPIIYDCGANIGISVLFFKSLYKNARIKAFEADRKISDILVNNLNRNSINDVEVIPKAVWVDDNGVEFSIDGTDAGSIYGQSNKYFVESVRLKDFIEKEDHIDFLKIDIEGAETSVIPDCDKVLYKVKNIFIEFHSFIDHPQNLADIISVLERNKFRYFIKSEEKRNSPFINKVNSEFPNFDLQLNIFAYKKN